ncbi:MAG: VWA domain-containing protein [Limnochordales bacterium]|nr:VWA domain-containing protein [Limnochordales bacterium]
MWRWGELVIAQPAGLLALLLIPLVILLHWLQQERQERTVPGLYLWQRLSRRLPRRSFWRQLLGNPLFWLQTTIAILFALLLSRLSWSPVQSQPWEWIVVVDRSASLTASLDGTLSRDEALLNQLQTLMNETPRDTRWTLVSAGPTAELIARDLNPHTPASRTVLEELPPPGGRVDWEAAGRLTAALSSDRTAAVVLLTDEAVNPDELRRFFPQLTRVITLAPPATEPVANLGIVDLQLQPVGDSLTRYQVLAVIANGGQTEAGFTLHWYNQERLLASDRARLLPGEKRRVVRQIALLPGTDLRLELIPDDPDLLPTDNRAGAVILPLRNVRVLLYAPGESAIARALAAAPRLTLVQKEDPKETLEFTVRDWANYDMVVFDRVLPPLRPPLPVVLIGVAPERAQAMLTPVEIAAISATGDAAGESAETVVDERHPLSRYVYWDEIRLFFPDGDGGEGGGRKKQGAAWSPWPLLPGSLPLWQERQGTLVQVAAGQPPRVIIAFDIYHSDWPKRLSFPIWAKNLLDWTVPWASRPVGPILRPGEALPGWFLGAAGGGPGAGNNDPGWEIITPDGSVQFLPPEQPLSAYRLPANAPSGAYWLRRPGGEAVAGWSVSLLAEEETRLSPSQATASGASEVAGQPSAGLLQPSPVAAAVSAAASRPLSLLEIIGTCLLILCLAVELAVALWESRPVARPRVRLQGGVPRR